MGIRASGRSALIITTGLLICFAGPMRSTESSAAASDTKTEGTSGTASSKTTKEASRHVRKQTSHSRSSDKAASKADAKKDKTAAEPDAVSSDGNKPSALPPSVADAQAQMTDADALASNAGRAVAARQIEPAQIQNLVSPDELNDLDRALSEDKPATPTMTLASIDVPQAATSVTYTTASSASGSDSTWNQTSLIGKLFIAFGGLLTVASAARMFMA
jgi:hypothetical protein